MTIISFFIDNWKEFAKKHNGSVKLTKTGLSPVGMGMSVWKKVYMTIPYKDSEIIFETGEATFMKIYYDFKKDIQETFLIYQEDYFDKIGKLLNVSKEITINDPEFDKKFFIKSNNEELMKSILIEDIKRFFIVNRKYIAAYKVAIEENTSVLNLNAPFDENNLEYMDEVISILKKTIDIIEDYIKNKC